MTHESPPEKLKKKLIRHAQCTAVSCLLFHYLTLFSILYIYITLNLASELVIPQVTANKQTDRKIDSSLEKRKTIIHGQPFLIYTRT